MSATFCLYRVSSADYLGSPFELKGDGAIAADIRKRLNLPDDCDLEATIKNIRIIENTEWSDGVARRYLDISDHKGMFKKCRGCRRLMERLETLPYKLYKGHKYVGLDQVDYAQGWNLKKRFFKKEITFVYCTTKQQMQNFFERYLDYSSGSDYWASKYVYDRFMREWEDGMVFECAW